MFICVICGKLFVSFGLLVFKKNNLCYLCLFHSFSFSFSSSSSFTKYNLCPSVLSVGGYPCLRKKASIGHFCHCLIKTMSTKKCKPGENKGWKTEKGCGKMIFRTLFFVKAITLLWESIAFRGQKLLFFHAFSHPTTDYQVVTTLCRFRCTRPAGNYFEILQAWGVNGRPPIGHFCHWLT